MGPVEGEDSPSPFLNQDFNNPGITQSDGLGEATPLGEGVDLSA